jgi:tetratricopeptide (TPR) repeat protein
VKAALLAALVVWGPRAAAQVMPASAVVPSTVPWYDIGESARRRGDVKAAKEAFQNLRDSDPDNGGALEGLTLSCMALGQNQEALGFAQEWDAKSPGSGYILGLQGQALHRLRREDDELPVNRRVVALDACDVRTQRHLDDEMRGLKDGVFPNLKISQSIGPEELNTSNPQRITYADRYGQVRVRQNLTPTLDVVGGASLDENSQLNDTGGFTYFDILEQVYSFGLEGRPNRDVGWQAEYGQSLLHDLKGSGVGRLDFSRVKLGAQWHVDDADLGVSAQRQPKYLRGTGGSSYFALLREDDLRAQAAAVRLGVEWDAAAGVSDFSEHTTYHDLSFSGTKEYGNELIVPSYSHSEQEWAGATPGGRIGFTVTDRGGVRWQRLIDDKYKLTASYNYTSYRDGNALSDLDATATWWLPWLKDRCGSRPLYLVYHGETLKYRLDAANYSSTTGHSNTIGAYWREGWRGGTWTMIGVEHGFLTDGIRGSYEGNAAVAEIEAYRRGDFSLTGSGRVGVTTVHDQAYSAGLNARYSY